MSLRPVKASMQLNAMAREMNSQYNEDDKNIDFSAAGLYLPAAQTVFATVVSSIVSILACWLFPIGSISAVRTLALTVSAGVLVIRRPLKIGNTKGVNTIFSALRPCCFLYVLCLVLEQLVHTCVSEESTYEAGYWRRIIYHTSMTVLIFAAFLRSKSPRSEDSDVPFFVSVVALLIIALLPPPAIALSGPLCSPPTLVGAGERILRAFFFSCVYVVLVYSSAPISNNLADTVVCVMRSATASAWILGSVIYAMPLAALQICVIIYFSFQKSSTEYEGVSDVEHGHHTDLSSRLSPTVSTSAAIDDHSDIVAAAAALTRKPHTVPDGLGSGSTLSFKLSLPAHMTEQQQQHITDIATNF
tara:strand:+ start:2931 stop:4007 length:1077 start_codon:yes stop_codon:yes gene_type:complete